jgi:hypothetical protein
MTPVSWAHSLLAAGAPAHPSHLVGQVGRRHDSRVHRVLQVVGAVRDAVGPADDDSLRRRRSGPGPGVVAHPVQRLAAEVQRHEHDVGAPDGVVVAARQERVERLLAGMATWPVPAVVADGDGLGERDVETDGAGHGRGDLVHLERVREPGALVVLGEDEDLRLAGQPPERRRVQDAVAVPLEAGALSVGLLRPGPVSGTVRPGRARLHLRVLALLALHPAERPDRPHPGLALAVRPDDAVAADVSRGRRRPRAGARRGPRRVGSTLHRLRPGHESTLPVMYAR